MPEPIPPPQQAPLITAGSGKVAQVAWAVGRTGAQGGMGKFILDGLQTFNIWQPSPDQREWVIIALGMLVAAVQWSLETWKGRKLLGASPEPATRAPEDEDGSSQYGVIVAVAALTAIAVIALLKVFNLL